MSTSNAKSASNSNETTTENAKTKTKPKKKATAPKKLPIHYSPQEETPLASEESKAKEAVEKQSRTVKNQVKGVPESVRVKVPLLNVRSEPTMTSEIVRTIEEGEELAVISHVFGYAQLADGTGYVHLDYVEKAKPTKCTCGCTSCKGGASCEGGPC